MNLANTKIGIIGGGQLGKMMILEAKRLGLYIVTLDPDENCPSHSISDEHIVAKFDDQEAYFKLAEKVDIITYEFEHIHIGVLEALEKNGRAIFPSVASLKVIQNKFTQNQALEKNGIPVPRFALVESVQAIREMGSPDKFGYPMMLKATMGGYDGKGNALIRNEADVEKSFDSLGGGKIQVMVEEFIDFEREISIIATRGIDGSRVIYPAAENQHKNNILDTTIVPARVPDSAVLKATEIATNVMEIFEGVGTFCTEMFVAKNGDVFVNEVAPRPHNSGHYTIEGCFANQFENHIRAITGLPLGNVELIQPTVMVNLLGENDGIAKLVGLEKSYIDSNIHVHFYGKLESKIGRKMGHFTVMDKTVEDAVKRAEKAKMLVKVVGE